MQSTPDRVGPLRENPWGPGRHPVVHTGSSARRAGRAVWAAVDRGGVGGMTWSDTGLVTAPAEQPPRGP